MIVNSKTRQFQKLKGAEKLILGTVQLGLNYGINNISGKPALEESFKILDTSFKAGISFLDTAEAYGNAVELIGEYHKKTPHNFHVINKFGALSEIRDLNKNVKDNLRKLNIHSFYAYLFHSPADLTNLKSNSLFVKQLQELKQEGLIERLGISIYTHHTLPSRTRPFPAGQVFPRVRAPSSFCASSGKASLRFSWPFQWFYRASSWFCD